MRHKFISSEARKNYILSQLYLVRYTQISKVCITIKVWIPIRLFIISLKAKVTVSESGVLPETFFSHFPHFLDPCTLYLRFIEL